MRWTPNAASATSSPSGWATFSAEDRPGVGGVDGQAAAEEGGGIEVAEDQVRVGEGRFVAAGPVADRPGHRPRASGADVQRARRIDPDQAAATRADLGDVEGRDAQDVAGPAVQPIADVQAGAHLVLGNVAWRAAFDERGLRGRATHVQGDRVGKVDAGSELLGSDDSGGRPGLDDLDRPPGRRARRHHAAVRLHHQDRRAHAQRRQARFELGQVAADDRLDVGVDDSRAGAFVLANLRQNLRGERKGKVRGQFGDDLGQSPLVGRIRVAVDERDREGANPLGEQKSDAFARRRFVQRLDLLSPRVQPLRDLDAPASLDERAGLAPGQVVQAGIAQSADLQGVPKAPSGEEAGRRAAVFENRVGGNGRSVDDLPRGGGIDAGLREQRRDALTNRLAVVLGSRRDLPRRDAACRVEKDQIRKGAPDVHADPNRSAGWGHKGSSPCYYCGGSIPIDSRG